MAVYLVGYVALGVMPGVFYLKRILFETIFLNNFLVMMMADCGLPQTVYA